MLPSFTDRLGASCIGVFSRRHPLFLPFILAVALAPLLARAGLALGFDQATLYLLFLLPVLCFAARYGLWPASTFALSLTLWMTYFFLPASFLHSLFNPRSVIALFVFESTAWMVSRLSDTVRAHAAESELQRRRTQRLHAVSHNVLLLNLQDSPERQIAEFIQQEFELDAVAMVTNLPHAIGAAGVWAQEDAAACEQRLRAVIASPDRTLGISIRPLLSARGPIGSLLILGDVPDLVLDSLASLATLALERHRASANESAAEAARKIEQLRTTVLDGLAHAFKTPLTIIRAASSGLLEAGALDTMQRQLTQMIDEQSEKLNDMTNRLLETARADEEAIFLQLETVDLPALVHQVVEEFRSDSPYATSGLPAHPAINLLADGSFTPVSADFDMIASTLQELLLNAAKYSSVGSPITVALTEAHDELILSVQSYGPVIRMEDRDRIFEKFYRGLDQRHAAPGTGLGLAVARGVTEAHGGQIWVTSSEEHGTTFHLSLPIKTRALTSTKG